MCKPPVSAQRGRTDSREDDAKLTICCRQTYRTKHDCDGYQSGQYWFISFREVWALSFHFTETILVNPYQVRRRLMDLESVVSVIPGG